jgi:hypothetical protein
VLLSAHGKEQGGFSKGHKRCLRQAGSALGKDGTDPPVPFDAGYSALLRQGETVIRTTYFKAIDTQRRWHQSRSRRQTVNVIIVLCIAATIVVAAYLLALAVAP